MKKKILLNKQRIDKSIQELHNYIYRHFWDGEKIIGPDIGIKLNKRIWRFFKSYLPFNWKDNHFFLQAQSYWIINNLELYQIYNEKKYLDYALKATQYIVKKQTEDGAWDYPLKDRKGLVATIEGCWAGIALLKMYEVHKNKSFLESAKNWNNYLEKNIGYEKYKNGLCINYFQKPRGLIPNNTTLALWFKAELFNSTKNKKYLEKTSDMIKFISQTQLNTGELPYCIGNKYEKTKIHYLCYQYNSFEYIDLKNYYKITNDKKILPIINKLEKYLLSGIQNNSCKNSCKHTIPNVTYYDAFLANAISNFNFEISQKIYTNLIQKQNTNGSFIFSKYNYRIFSDNRPYPRSMGYILNSLIELRKKESQIKYTILITCKLDDNVVVSHLTPISDLENVQKIYVIRDNAGKAIPKVEYITSSSKNRFMKIINKFYNIIKYGKKSDLLWAYYLIPHGINAIVAAKILKKPVGVSLIGTDLNEHLNNKYSSTLLKILKHADIITVTGSTSKKVLAEKGIITEKITILPNAIDIHKFRNLNLKKKYDFIFVGRLVEVKQIDKIIDLMSKIVEHKKNSQLAIIGDGPERKRLEDLIKQKRINKNVLFLGYQNDIPKFLNQSKFMVMASKSEGIPIAMLEAMSCGVIPIVPDVGDISDAAKKNNSIVYTEIDDKLVQRITILMNNPKEYQKMKSNAQISTNFYTNASVSKTWTETLEGL